MPDRLPVYFVQFPPQIYSLVNSLLHYHPYAHAKLDTSSSRTRGRPSHVRREDIGRWSRLIVALGQSTRGSVTYEQNDNLL